MNEDHTRESPDLVDDGPGTAGFSWDLDGEREGEGQTAGVDSEKKAETVRSQEVRPARFVPVKEAQATEKVGNLDLLLDVPLPLVVELGRTTMAIRDILALGTGSVIELDRVAGEPVDILANNKLIARGEVVVIDDNFGIRITEIVSAQDRQVGQK